MIFHFEPKKKYIFGIARSITRLCNTLSINTIFEPLTQALIDLLAHTIFDLFFYLPHTRGRVQQKKKLRKKEEISPVNT